jgi:glycosyltransferase involved in cell wall biosynthesis
MFSVVIPLYNKSAYILKAIHSVLNQTYTEFEIIVIDDGSKDDGLQKVKEIEDNRIYIITQKNAGVSTARNNGVAIARNNFVAFLDADDWWDSNFLREMDQLIKDFPGAGIYGCNYYYVEKGVNIISEKGFRSGFKAGYIDYFKIFSSTLIVPFNCSFVIVDRNIFNNVGGFNPQLKFGEDMDLWIRIALKCKVAYLNKPLAYSNQDSYTQNRAVAPNKLYKKNDFFIFNLDYLEPYESTNRDLKLLLDGSRTQLLLPYYKKKMYPREVKEILSKVNFKTQPFFYRIIYTLPHLMIEPFLLLVELGIIIKKLLNYLLGKNRLFS